MSSEPLEAEADLGRATIVYEDPDEGTIERTVANEQIAYVQDHWTFKAGEDDEGNDLVRRVPAQRVHHVERTVEEFEEEVVTIRNQVQSLAEGLRTRLPIGGESSGDRDESAEGDGRP